jgi:hypothetical protein
MFGMAVKEVTDIETNGLANAPQFSVMTLASQGFGAGKATALQGA